jgi:hypothetical protein
MSCDLGSDVRQSELLSSLDVNFRKKLFWLVRAVEFLKRGLKIVKIIHTQTSYARSRT